MQKFSSALLAILLAFAACSKEDNGNNANTDFKQKMREFVIGISQYAKATDPGFIVIPQNGIELVTVDGESDGQPHTDYLNAIDANGQEDLFYGYDNDNEATPNATTAYLKGFLDISKNAGNTILTTDYCSTLLKMDDAHSKNQQADYISFAADHRELDHIPQHPNPIHGENSEAISSMQQVKNFLYLINPSGYATKADFIGAVRATNFDLLIMDAFFHDGTAFTAAEIGQLRDKANGGKRLVISYMSIGEAEDYRYYWQPSWNSQEPLWMDAENPDWAGNFKVKYWEKAWQDIIFGGSDAYLDKILAAGFDGVYLDIIDAFEYYE
jgi:cysteinyl-tRNA synthetase